LIVEKAGESLSKELYVSQQGATSSTPRKAIIDPSVSSVVAFSGRIDSQNGTYDLSTSQGISGFSALSVENVNTSNATLEREKFSSLCAVCHTGNYTSPVNGLYLPVDINTHPNASNANKPCSDCHVHGLTF
jgi:hypothetical protein